MKIKTDGTCLCENRVLALAWRGLTAAACCAGLWPMLFGGTFSSRSLCYFTIQSNLIIAALFLALAAGTLLQIVRDGKTGTPFHIAEWLQLGAVFIIQITFLVFAFLLSGTMFSMGEGIAFSNILLHYVAPLMALADWILYMPHGGVTYKHAALWLAYPAAYVVFSFIRADLGEPFFNGSRFPYFFMDADAQGWNLLWIAPLFFAGYFALGCALVRADRALAGTGKNKK